VILFIVFNVHAPSENKSDDEQESFCEALEPVFDQISKYHINVLFFSAKIGKEDIFKPTIGNESLRETTNGNPEIRSSRVQCFHIPTFVNTHRLLLMKIHTDWSPLRR
jgi:hypothetical protein